MRLAALAIIPMLIGPMSAGEAQPLAKRVQQALRVPGSDLPRLQAELDQAPEQPDRSYWLAMVAYARLGQTQDPQERRALFTAAMNHLKDRTDADSLALKGSLLGAAISLHPEKAMAFIGQAMASFSRARELAPRNPRVRLLEAIHTLHTPEAFGGGPAAALPLLEATAALAEAEAAPADPWAPAWGRPESLAWLALAEARMGRMDKARTHLDLALGLDPAYGFARTFVAPEIK